MTKSIVRDATRRPRILHVDDDAEALRLVDEALGETTDLVSVKTIDRGPQRDRQNHFDLAILDVAIGGNLGLDLLPELRNSRNDVAIPVVILSAYGTHQMCGTHKFKSYLDKSRQSIDGLLATVHSRLALRGSCASKEVSR